MTGKACRQMLPCMVVETREKSNFLEDKKTINISFNPDIKGGCPDKAIVIQILSAFHAAGQKPTRQIACHTDYYNDFMVRFTTL